MDEETVKLGGNIELTGFRDLDGGTMVIIRKIVGNYVRRMSDVTQNFEALNLTVKPVHGSAGSKRYELHGKLLDNGKVFTSEVTENNIFVAVDTVLKKIENSMN